MDQVVQVAETISIFLTSEQLRTLRESIAAGEYTSVSDALRDAVRLWQRQREEYAERLNAVRARIRRSLDDTRPDLTLEQVDAHLEELFAEAERDSRPLELARRGREPQDGENHAGHPHPPPLQLSFTITPAS